MTEPGSSNGLVAPGNEESGHRFMVLHPEFQRVLGGVDPSEVAEAAASVILAEVSRKQELITNLTRWQMYIQFCNSIRVPQEVVKGYLMRYGDRCMREIEKIDLALFPPLDLARDVYRAAGLSDDEIEKKFFAHAQKTLDCFLEDIERTFTDIDADQGNGEQTEDDQRGIPFSSDDLLSMIRLYQAVRTPPQQESLFRFVCALLRACAEDVRFESKYPVRPRSILSLLRLAKKNYPDDLRVKEGIKALAEETLLLYGNRDEFQADDLKTPLNAFALLDAEEIAYDLPSLRLMAAVSYRGSGSFAARFENLSEPKDEGDVSAVRKHIEIDDSLRNELLKKLRRNGNIELKSGNLEDGISFYLLAEYLSYDEGMESPFNNMASGGPLAIPVKDAFRLLGEKPPPNLLTRCGDKMLKDNGDVDGCIRCYELAKREVPVEAMLQIAVENFTNLMGKEFSWYDNVPPEVRMRQENLEAKEQYFKRLLMTVAALSTSRTNQIAQAADVGGATRLEVNESTPESSNPTTEEQ